MSTTSPTSCPASTGSSSTQASSPSSRSASFKKKAFFAKDGADKAKDKQDRVIYDTDSGEVRFDKDGKGKTKAVLVAVLDGSPDLAHSDILVIA